MPVRSWLSNQGPWRARLLSVGVIVTSASIALVVALLIGAPLGADHGCPHGAPITSCRYPPDTSTWLIGWGVGGLVVGVVLAVALAVLVLDRTAVQRPRRHLVAQPPTQRPRGPGSA